ncbi:MAG: two-component system, OmpR family, sensor histidine kinase MprB, partial [Streptomyces sp.]|nr:two-component system, OmpR family, sensor histidine kinase MprB [Streptomyces sp.]
MIKRFRSLPIRSRLALLVAAAVAFAVAAVSVTCWFIVEGKLYGELNADLTSQKSAVPYAAVQNAITNCGENPKADTNS